MSFLEKILLAGFSKQDKKTLVKIWVNILKSRLFEEKLLNLIKEKKIKQHWFFSGKGQEGGQATVCTLLNEGDYLLPSYRGYCQVISRGFPLKLIAAEILSKKTGVAKGIGLSFSFSAPEYGIYRNSHLLGLDMGTIIGMAINLKNKKTGNIAVIFFGDGAATRGSLWSALNLSVIWKLPILWVCENNQYSVTTHVSKIFGSSFAKAASSFGLKAEMVESNKVISSFSTIKRSINYVRHERKPLFLELKTYRIGSHDMFFITDQSYQDKDEIKYWSQLDPLLLLEKELTFGRVIKPGYASLIENEAEKEINGAFEEAEKSEGFTEKELLNYGYE